MTLRQVAALGRRRAPMRLAPLRMGCAEDGQETTQAAGRAL